jgi:hypothetical protein
VQVAWTDASEGWLLEVSHDLSHWAAIGSEAYTQPENGWFYYAQGKYRSNEFYRLREIGSSSIYVVGDSLSTWPTWPDDLEVLLGRSVFSQAIGGSQSLSMVKRAQGVELKSLVYEEDLISTGSVQLKWKRHIADRTQLEQSRVNWAAYAKTVSEPIAIEVYEVGQLVGFANHVLKPIVTDYENQPKAIFCQEHGLEAGDQLIFVSNDPAYPDDLSTTSSYAQWRFSSPWLPVNLVEERVYFAANIAENSFELLEYAGDHETMDIGGDALDGVFVELGWSFELPDAAEPLEMTWKPRTKYDDQVWLLEVSANDMPSFSVSDVTVPNIEKLIDQMLEVNKRFLIVCPVPGSYPQYGPSSTYWDHYHTDYMGEIRSRWAERHLDTLALLGEFRSETELSFLSNPNFAELLWIRGDATDQSTWEYSSTEITDATQTWVGPGYTPLQFRAHFGDRIHLNAAANLVIAEALSVMLQTRGW